MKQIEMQKTWEGVADECFKEFDQRFMSKKLHVRNQSFISLRITKFSMLIDHLPSIQASGVSSLRSSSPQVSRNRLSGIESHK